MTTQAASQARDSAARKAPERPKYGPQGRGHGPMGARPTEKAISFWPSTRRLMGQLRPERLLIIAVVVMTVFSVIGEVVGPRILGQATNTIFAGIISKQLPAGVTKEQIIEMLRAAGKPDFADMVAGLDLVPGQGIQFGVLGQVVLLAVAVYAVSGIVNWISGWVLNGIVQRSVYRLRKQVSDKLNRLSISFYDKQPRGELLSRVTNDIDNIAQSLQQTLNQLVSSLLLVIGVVAMMFWVSPMLALIALISIPLGAFGTAIIGKRSQKLFAEQWKATGEVNSQVEEAFSGHALVKVFGRRREVSHMFAEKNNQMYRASFGAQFVSNIIMPMMFFIGNLNYVLIAVVGGLRVASGTMSLGDVQAFIQYSRMFTRPLSQIASMANLLQSGVASAERVFEVLDTGEETPDGNSTIVEPQGDIVFDDVHFSYLPEKPLIQGFTLHAEPGDTIAIVGPTGAGKTTMVNLLVRFYDPQSGRILFDGIDISTVPRAQLRAEIGMVLQDAWLFGGTIRDNIAYGRLDATEDEIVAAAKATYVDRFVRSLPKGYDTVVDEEGNNISAGERQLLTIARAFLADPTVLILDEATSSVDTRTEVLVQQAMKALRADRTSFVIAHRLSTIRDADTIVVMEDGAIVEQGDHEALLAAKGAYYRLYQSQFAAAVA